VSIDQGQMSSASVLYAESLRLSRDGGNRLEVLCCLEGLAVVACNARPERALRLTGAASALRERLGRCRIQAELARIGRVLERAQRRLGPERYSAAWTAGKATPEDEAVALALAPTERDARVDSGLSALSARERDVLHLIARGYSNRQIAEQLVIAPRTAETHVGNILTKLNLQTRAELTDWAVRQGLLATT
jgi:DNA-binding CsgD family transcriptional regulator